jgi:predicted oxidoreductase
MAEKANMHIEPGKIISGCWRLHEWNKTKNELLDFIEAACELGITHFDHADIYGDYGNEELFGRALALQPGLRRKLFLISKCGIRLTSDKNPDVRVKHYDTSASHIRTSVDNSLRNLQTDYLDMLLIHRPDFLADPMEIAVLVRDLIHAGKIRQFGVSNFSPAQVDNLNAFLEEPISANQIEYSLLQMQAQDDASLVHAQQHRYRLQAWSPLAGGRLFDRREAASERLHDPLKEIAHAHDTFASTIALAWLFRHPMPIDIIVGTGKLERLRQAVAAKGIQLSREEWTLLWQAARGREVA